MAYGDIGGAVTNLVITCTTASEGDVDIKRHDAVCLMGENYMVGNNAGSHRPLFGQALADATENDFQIPVLVRGVCVFRYVLGTQGHPVVDGVSGVIRCESGFVTRATPFYGQGVGLVLAVFPERNEVHVLL